MQLAMIVGRILHQAYAWVSDGIGDDAAAIGFRPKPVYISELDV